jgi:glycosyltransferase involved in cell wall biosynthesis
MRILLVAPYFPPEVTGSSNFVHDLAVGLTNSGHTVCVLTATASRSHELFEVCSLPAKRVSPGRIAFGYTIPTVLTRKNIHTVKELFDTFKPDLVSSHGQIFDITLLANSIAHKHGIPTTMTVHSAIWHDNPMANFVLTLGDYFLSYAFLKRTTSAWIGVDDRTLKHIKRRYSRNFSAIPICIRRGVFSNGDAELAREKYQIAGSPVIASIGHVVPVRNRVALINCLPRLIESFPHIEVLIAGRVADETFLQRAAELGVSGHLRILGAVPHDDIKHLLAASDIEVHDLQGYGLGIGSLEPIDAGVPIVAYVRNNNLPGLDLQEISSEAFLQSNDAKTISEAILKTLQDGETRERILQAEKKLLEETYYLEIVTSKYEDLFKTLVRE